MRRTLPVSIWTLISRTALPIGLRRLAAGGWPGRQEADLLGEYIVRLMRHQEGFDHPQRGVRLQPRDDAAVGGVELPLRCHSSGCAAETFRQLRPSGIVIIAEVKDIGCASLDRHLLGRSNVVDTGGRKTEIEQAVGIRVIDDMSLGAAQLVGEARPLGAEAAERDGDCNRSAARNRRRHGGVRRSTVRSAQTEPR